MRKIRVLIVDDHTLFRECLHSYLSSCNNLEVVGEVGDGIEAVQKTKNLHPDVVLMDFAMPNMNGLQATRQIKRVAPSVKILILTMYDTDQHIDAILNAGASGCIFKKAEAQELISAIKTVFLGNIYLHPSVATKVITDYMKLSKGTKENTNQFLTEREREILGLIAEGKTNKKITDLLGISIHTVQTHRLNLMRKLDAHDSTQLVRYAIRRGLIIP